jgi:hypothetical protein
MKLEYRLLPCWPEPQFTSFHLFPLSGLRYKTTGDALIIGLGREWKGNAVLYQGSGIQRFLSDMSEKKVLLRGARVLPNLYSSALITDLEYQFALKTRKPAFDFVLKGTTLKPDTPSSVSNNNAALEDEFPSLCSFVAPYHNL